MRTILTLLMLATILLGGCYSPSHTPPEPGAKIGWANNAIDSQRQLKRALLQADPYEHAVEAMLNDNPRVESARFALVTLGGGFSNIACEASQINGRHYQAVVTTHEPMALEYVQALLLDTFETAELRESGSTITIDGNTWAASGTVSARSNENPVLTGSMRE